MTYPPRVDLLDSRSNRELLAITSVFLVGFIEVELLLHLILQLDYDLNPYI